ncbi:hypothetical protein [Nafulsella turpanensis]|uniref:hypothetical protein n=1 Tax=Nafulsella turpanensis TaxID=1265690 RepID=UPI00034CF9B0|nr:hypothetical protein [Nafulsella turpanensis]
MFDGAGFPKPLDEELFDTWLENGRQSKLNSSYLLIIWNELDAEYQPVYVENRTELDDFPISSGRESLVAAYDLYSESRII